MNKNKLKTPNIVLILADDFGYGDAGCYGAEKIPTPHIDNLAREGMKFTDAHASHSVCTPSRYSLLTGRYCWRGNLKHGIVSAWDDGLLEEGRTTLESMLKERGYTTACVGKWHMGWGWHTTDGKEVDRLNGSNVDYSRPVFDGPRDRGFDYSFCFPGPLDFPPYCFFENGRVVDFPTTTIEKEKSHIPKHLETQRDGAASPLWRNEDVGPVITEKACHWLEGQVLNESPKPFFLYMPLSAPHIPCTPPDFIKGKSQAGARGDMCVEVDWSVGQIVKTLEKIGAADNTILIYASDNGALHGDTFADRSDWPSKEYGHSDNYETYGHKANGNLRGRKHLIYDGGHRVPLVIKWTGRIKRGTINDTLFCYTDFLATFAALLGYELKENEGEDSFNALNLLLENRADEDYRDHVIHQGHSGMLSLRKGKWKLIHGKGQGAFDDSRFDEIREEYQLFNMADDIEEKNDLASERPEIVTELMGLLKTYKNTRGSRKEYLTKNKEHRNVTK